MIIIRSSLVFLSVVLLLVLELLVELLLAADDVSVEFFTVLADGELLIVIERNVDLLLAHRLVIRVVELRHVRML